MSLLSSGLLGLVMLRVAKGISMNLELE